MRTVIQALVWEQVWKNRMVFPALAFLFILGAWLTHLLVGADPEAWWLRVAQRTLLTSFFASVLLSFAPFTLMESHHGWRMNSMVTRWFTLPVRTEVLVLIPFVAACAVVGLVVTAWLALFQQLVPQMNVLPLGLALVLGVAVMQTLAWILPRKPSQFWPALALWFPALVLLTLILVDGPVEGPFLSFVQVLVLVAVPVLGVLACLMARLNRCGLWPGEIPLSGLWQWSLRNQPSLPSVRTPAAALFWSDVVPVVRTFLLTWTGFVVLVLGSQILVVLLRGRTRGLDFGMLLQVLVVLMPPLAMLWLPVSGLLLGGEPGTGFRTRLSPFRAARPVSSGTLAAQRVWAALALWLFVWVPWFILLQAQTHLHPRWAGVDLPEIYANAGRLMAISAHLLVGALPLFLWGRFEGFPNLLLASMVSWAGTYGLTAYLAPPPSGELGWAPALWLPLLGLLSIKLAAGLVALGLAWRAGHITWRYGAILISGWSALLGLLVWALPTWTGKGAWGLVTTAILLPFARLAVAPLALAANRHR